MPGKRSTPIAPWGECLFPRSALLVSAVAAAFVTIVSLPGSAAGEQAATRIVRGVAGDGACAIHRMSAEQSQLLALQMARAAAIEKAAGVRVVSSTLVRDGAVAVDLIRTYTRGFIVAEKVEWLPLAQYHDSPDRPPIPEYRVRITADVAIPAKDAAPVGLAASLDNKVYRSGEKARLELSTQRAARVAVFNIRADDRVVLLFPGEHDKANSVSPGKRLVFPADGAMASLVMETLPGHDRDAEAFFVVAVGEETEADFRQRFASTLPMALTDFFERYAEIAAGAEEVILPYAVERNE